MLLTRIACDGCGRRPRFWEWIRGELSQDGYHEWRHPGIVFRACGLPLVYDNQGKAQRIFNLLFGRPLPEELSYLCPECQAFAETELPGLIATDPGDPPQTGPYRL